MNKGIVGFLKENKKITGMTILLLVGVLLIFISSPKREGESADTQLTLTEYKEMLQAELASMCSDVQGVGACRVFVTFERGEQSNYKGSVMIESRPPKVDGITVICRGADAVAVREELTEMLSALFGIGSHRIAILKLNS